MDLIIALNESENVFRKQSLVSLRGLHTFSVYFTLALTNKFSDELEHTIEHIHAV